jgi:hypothetical protein
VLSSPSNHPVTFEVAKVNKRPYLRELETGKLVYTPPDWVRSRLNSREPMADLARAMTERLRYDVNLIIEFETRFNPRLRRPHRLQAAKALEVVEGVPEVRVQGDQDLPPQL